MSRTQKHPKPTKWERIEHPYLGLQPHTEYSSRQVSEEEKTILPLYVRTSADWDRSSITPDLFCQDRCLTKREYGYYWYRLEGTTLLYAVETISKPAILGPAMSLIRLTEPNNVCLKQNCSFPTRELHWWWSHMSDQISFQERHNNPTSLLWDLLC
jgi:hypothetical protein